ncbi:hypothetical protein [Paenibacillus wynnii]|uniref:hypothetical protein n=1 Tax=Paenibacillus wynnii TaxID=268407 RepID=UPI0012FA4F60|nr:hypothetical protein [Paenibacillus wynnii]
MNKFLYIGALIYLPVFYYKKDLQVTEQLELFLYIFVLLSFVIAPISNSVILEAKRDKYICVKLLRISPTRYTQATLGFKFVHFFVYFLPAVIVFFSIFGASTGQAILFTLLMTAWRLIGEALTLWIFDKTDIILWKKYTLVWSAILAGTLAAYIPLAVGNPFAISRVIFNLPISFAILTLGVIAVFYIAKYPDYRRAVDAVTKIDEPLLDMGKMISTAKQAEVSIKESDSSSTYSAIDRYSDKTGYAYLNAIFFDRHRRFLIQPVIRRLYVIAVLTAAGFASMLIFPEASFTLASQLVDGLPILVFIMYFTSIGERVCKAMFYNCDISLLRYGFYRDQETILQNFKIRFMKIAGLNLIPSAAICIAVSALILFSGVHWPMMDAFSFLLSIIFLSLFFSVHHLFMYYIFQPYSTEFNMKNPFFRIVNGIVYGICIICFQFQSTPAYFAVVVLIATMVYITAALILVYKLSPRTFRIK